MNDFKDYIKHHKIQTGIIIIIFVVLLVTAFISKKERDKAISDESGTIELESDEFIYEDIEDIESIILGE